MSQIPDTHPSGSQKITTHHPSALYYPLISCSSSLIYLLRLGQLKQGNRLTEIRPVDTIWHDVGSFIADHELASLRAQSPKVDVGRVLDIDHAFLTTLRAQTSLRVPILEEIVQPTTVHEDGTGVQDSKTPSPSAIRMRTVCKGRIMPAALWCEIPVKCVWVALEIRRLMLNVAHEDILRVGELVVVHDAVLRRRAVQPHWTVGRLEEEATMF